MAVRLREDAEGKTLEVHASGKLTKDDYGLWVPELERLIGKHGKIRILFAMEDFHGWSAGALWEDIKFDMKHFSDIERLALVGEKKWQEGMSKFCRPFTTAQIRYFTEDQLDEARAWLREETRSEATPAS